MLVFRRRLIYWLIKEYIKRWGKTITFFFLIGILAFAFLREFLGFFTVKIPLVRDESIGLVGAYTIDTMPPTILNKLSYGLTVVDENGSIQPKIAKSWKIEEEGKKYVFTLRENMYFTDGTNITADMVTYNFSDAKVERLGKYTIAYTLRESYSPFLVTVSRPLFKKGLVGVGSLKIKDVDVNGPFVETITLVDIKNPYKRKIYRFYPDAESLKIAYLLGEVSVIFGSFEPTYKGTAFNSHPNTSLKRRVNYQQLVTLFFNTKDSMLSDRNLRSGLLFALPNDFADGQRAHSPYPPSAWVYSEQILYTQDREQSLILTKDFRNASASAQTTLVIKSLPRYKKTAQIIIDAWDAIGIQGKMEIVDTIPTQFQIFLGDFFVPKDPDQYRLWHSAQETNIAKYENKRIDKLLEDGRKTLNKDERQKLYADFQKYLLADAPAAFLYFPYEYEIKRK